VEQLNHYCRPHLHTGDVAFFCANHRKGGDMECVCDCTGQMVNGIVYGMGLVLIVWTIAYLFIDTVTERGD